MKSTTRIIFITACGLVLLLALLLRPDPALPAEPVLSQAQQAGQRTEPDPETEPPLPEEDVPAGSAEESGRQSPAAEADQPTVLGPAPAVYEPDPGLSPEALIADYFDVQYRAYVNLSYVDLSAVLDLELDHNRTMQLWNQLLAQRRRLLAEDALCYVEQNSYSYTLAFEEEPEDDRMDFWQQEEEDLILHLRITGEAGRAYPPILAVNAQHTMTLRQREDGRWIILRHYFPGAVRKFMRAGEITLPTDEEMLEQLREEFRPVLEPEAVEIPLGAAWYGPDSAVNYAMEYTEQPNPAFYHIGDWMGNCANFVSQCVWAGFGGGTDGLPARYNAMTGEWYGGDGGSSAWENVNSFWNYITTSADLHGEIFVGADLLEPGDIIQTRTASGRGEDGRYNHMMLVVDRETLKLAQNSPACFVYYSDLVNVETRTVRPVYLIAP